MTTTDFFRDQFGDVAAQRRTVTVYADDPYPGLAAHFDDWNVEVRFDRLPAGTEDGFVTVRRGAEFLGSFDLAVLEPFLEPTVAGTRAGPGTDDGRSLDPFMSLLDDTTFRAFDRASMLAASREFEDRAWRVGEGCIHAGFQRPDALAAQRDVYADLAARGVDAHVYFDGEWTADPVEGVTLHSGDDDSLGRFWFVAFVDDDQHCALVAEERDAGFTGFWTYDEARVTAIDEYLRSTYW